MSALNAGSGHWIVTLACALLAAAFASGLSTLRGLPITRLKVIRDSTTERNRRALVRFLNNPTSVLSRWLVWRVGCTALVTLLIAQALQPLGRSFAMGAAVVGTLATYGVLAEAGTAIAARNLDRSAPLLLRMLYPLELLASPFALLFALVSRVSGRLRAAPRTTDSRIPEQEVGLLLAESQEAGGLPKDHAEMIQKLLEFDVLTAADVMVPRTSLMAIECHASIDDVLPIISSKGHSRYPVYCDSIDNIVGLLYAKDLFRVLNDIEKRKVGVQAYIRAPVNFVPESKPIAELLREMQAHRHHMAVVVDDYGGVSGIVTLEDIMEEIIGDIQDEHDVELRSIVELGNGRLLVDAATPVDDLAEYLKTDLPDDGDFVSVGGLVIHRAGRVPARGCEVEAYGLRFIVREADERRVSKVEIVRRGQRASGDGTRRSSHSSPT